jgi:hypothetical protein
MSNNAETNNDDRDINTLKSTINSLIQEIKKLLGPATVPARLWHKKDRNW